MKRKQMHLSKAANLSKKQDHFSGGAIEEVTRTEDYSDVVVLEADSTRIPWPEVWRINDDEMRDLMRQIVNRLYTFHLSRADRGLRSETDRWMSVAGKWDEPELDPGMIRSADEPGK